MTPMPKTAVYNSALGRYSILLSDNTLMDWDHPFWLEVKDLVGKAAQDDGDQQEHVVLFKGLEQASIAMFAIRKYVTFRRSVVARRELVCQSA